MSVCIVSVRGSFIMTNKIELPYCPGEEIYIDATTKARIVEVWIKGSIVNPHYEFKLEYFEGSTFHSNWVAQCVIDDLVYDAKSTENLS